MTTSVQRRRGTTAQHSTFTGLEGEITVDTTKDTAVVHDGSTAGGFPLAREDLSNISVPSLSALTGSGTASDDLFLIYDTSTSSLKKITRDELNNAIEQDALANVTITGGSINGTTVGASTASTGAFTSLSASGTVSGTGFSNYLASPPSIGSGTAGSGAFTTLSASGAFSANGGATLGDASGDALTINSSAVSIPNGLNFDSNTLVIDATNNRVGVGVASPTSALDVSAGANTDIRVNTSGSGYLQLGQFTNGGFIATSSSDATAGALRLGTSATERMRIDTSGNVGIGTSSPAARLDVRTAAGTAAQLNLYTGNNTAASTLQFAQIGAIGWDVGITATNGHFQIGVNGGGLGYNINRSGTAIDYHSWLTSGTERMRIDSSGNVGIGTSSPSGKLSVTTSTMTNQIIADSMSDSTTYGLVSLNASRISTGYLGIAGGGGTDKTLFLNVPTGGKYSFRNNFSEQMQLNASGNLGLGVTPSAWSVYKAFDIGRGALVNASTETDLVHNAYWNGTNWIYKATDYATHLLQINGQYRFYTAPSGTAGNAITFTQAMTLDASGNLGVGTTSPRSAGAGYQGITLNGTNSGFLDINTNGTRIFTMYGITNDAYFVNPTATGNLLYYTNNTERMRIDSSGRLLVNRSATGGSVFDSCNVQVTGNISISRADPELILQNTGTDARVWRILGSTSGGATAALRFYDDTAGAERMRIDSSGTLLVGQTTNPTTSSVVIKVPTGSANGVNAQITSNTGTSYPWANYNATGTYVGGISCTSTGTSFPTSSDYRLKENIAPMTGALTKVAQLKPVTYTWKLDGSDGQGFIAHELAEVCPDAVVGEKDAVDAEGKPVYQGIDTSFLTATLTAAIQELHEVVKAQAIEIAELKAKIQ